MQQSEKRGLYRVKASELPTLASYMAKSFQGDPLFCALMPNIQEEQLAAMMEAYFLDAMKEFYPLCSMYSLDDSLQSALIVFDSVKALPKTDSVWEVAAMTLAYFKDVLGVKALTQWGQIYDTYKLMVKNWPKAFVTGRFIHVEILFLDQSLRGKGGFRRLMEPLLRFADARGLPLTLETHNFQNIKKYESLGFQLVGALENKSQTLTQYCLVRKGLDIG